MTRFVYKTGDIFAEDADAIVNPVNCVGVMGKGLALQFKRKFPENFKAYKLACEYGEVQPGKMFVFSPISVTRPNYIINFPTKRHWREKSRLEDIESGLSDLRRLIINSDMTSIAIPPIGCGLGGLDWLTVMGKIEQLLSNIDNLRVVVFAPK